MRVRCIRPTSAYWRRAGNTPKLDTLLRLALVFDADPAEWVREIVKHYDSVIEEIIKARRVAKGADPDET